MELYNLILDLYGTSDEKQRQVCSRILSGVKDYKPKELVKLIISLVQTNISNHVNQKLALNVRSSNISDLLDQLVANNLDKLKSKEVSDSILIEALLNETLQDSFLRFFLKHELSLGWVDDLLELESYQTRIEAIIQMNISQFSVGLNAAKGKKFSKEAFLALAGSKKKLVNICADKIFNPHTSFIATGLISLLQYHQHLNFNYDLLCSQIETSPESAWQQIPPWTSILQNLKPTLSDKKILSFLQEAEDSFYLIDSAAMIKNLKRNAPEVLIPVTNSLVSFHEGLVELTRTTASPNQQFTQELILSWEGEEFNESLKVHIPLSTEELKACGEALKMCVGHAGYDNKIIYGKSNIFFLMEGNKFKYCIEIAQTKEQTWKVIQARGLQNAPLPTEVDWDLRVFLSTKNNPILT